MKDCLFKKGNQAYYEVESVLNKRMNKNETQYLVKWTGYPEN